jgi:hypothetical protein
VAGGCECGNEPLGSGATELVTDVTTVCTLFHNLFLLHVNASLYLK